MNLVPRPGQGCWRKCVSTPAECLMRSPWAPRNRDGAYAVQLAVSHVGMGMGWMVRGVLVLSSIRVTFPACAAAGLGCFFFMWLKDSRSPLFRETGAGAAACLGSCERPFRWRGCEPVPFLQAKLWRPSCKLQARELGVGAGGLGQPSRPSQRSTGGGGCVSTSHDSPPWTRRCLAWTAAYRACWLACLLSDVVSHLHATATHADTK